MVTAVDTNILLDVFLDDSQYRQASFVALSRALMTGDVIVCDVVWSETGAAFDDRDKFTDAMETLGLQFSPMTKRAATLASELWRGAKCRKSVPPRRVVADFLVGAHAMECADCLLTRDKGFYRDYFSDLTVIDPQ